MPDYDDSKLKKFAYLEVNPAVYGTIDIPIAFGEEKELGKFVLRVDRGDKVKLDGNVGWSVRRPGAFPRATIELLLYKNDSLIQSFADTANPAADKLRLTRLAAAEADVEEGGLVVYSLRAKGLSADHGISVIGPIALCGQTYMGQ